MAPSILSHKKTYHRRQGRSTKLTIIKTIFPRKFYIQFKAPLHDELIDYVQQSHAVDNDRFKWGKWAVVDKSPIKWSESMQLLIPSIPPTTCYSSKGNSIQLNVIKLFLDVDRFD